MKDFGDKFPSDTGDALPGSPTSRYSEENTRFYTKKRPNLEPIIDAFTKDIDEFDEIYLEEGPWFGHILGYTTTVDEIEYYDVVLQTGDIISVGCENSGPDVFYDGQIVTVNRGQAANTFFIASPMDRVQELFKVQLNGTLVVGGDIEAFVVEYDGAIYNKTGDTIQVYDGASQNYGLDGEIFDVQYDYLEQKAKIIGSKGLIRLGIANATIAAAGNGAISIYDKDGDTTVDITAYYTWMHNSTDLSLGKEVTIKYFEEFEQWIIIARECE